ncbi:hypothetical protein RR46_09354 [Papilio xuthus]|uniref:Uncharacterized protein n=1 Tax=Papilio xuthus TaxID=66420 RepID=A0A194PVU5_PAPXU|nr:hypothetical protein RR46_09354 [Papilio xuthus]
MSSLTSLVNNLGRDEIGRDKSIVGALHWVGTDATRPSPSVRSERCTRTDHVPAKCGRDATPARVHK